MTSRPLPTVRQAAPFRSAVLHVHPDSIAERINKEYEPALRMQPISKTDNLLFDIVGSDKQHTFENEKTLTPMDLANWRRRITRLSARAARDVGGEPRQAPPSRTVWPRPRRQPL